MVMRGNYELYNVNERKGAKFMKQIIGYSSSGNVEEAVNAMTSPQAIIFFAGKDYVENAAKEIAAKFPEAVSIGCVGQSYAEDKVYDDGLLVLGYEGASAVAGVIEDVGTMPLASIEDIRKNAEEIKAGKDNTVCVDFTTGNDAELVTTFNIVLRENNIPLVGGTAWEDTVACNGKVYNNACVYMFLKNTSGKIKAYKENLYGVHPAGYRHVATKVDPTRSALFELDGKPVQEVYAETLGIPQKDLAGQTIMNPLGRVIGNEVYLLSLKEEIENQGFTCYKKVNHMDIITVMELKDMTSIINGTINQIRGDFSKISGMFSVNCIFRHVLFEQKNYETEYLNMMNALGTHAGLYGLGEHYNTQHVNQTMSGFAFE